MQTPNHELNIAIEAAIRAVNSGEARQYRVSHGCLDVETDQGWRQWFPEPEGCPEEALD